MILSCREDLTKQHERIVRQGGGDTFAGGAGEDKADIGGFKSNSAAGKD